MNETHRISLYGVLLASLGFWTVGCENSDEADPNACEELPPAIEERFQRMSGPLGCSPSEVLPGEPPGGCDGAEELLESARREYLKLWSEGGCATEPPDLTPSVNSYQEQYASEHSFVEHRIERGEFEIAAREFGVEHAGSAPTIVLMHGFPDDQRLYDAVAPSLGDTHHTVTFDFVGWGESSRPGSSYEYTTAALLSDLEAVVSHFELDQVVPVVHDASGWPGIDWALDHSEAVTALVLLNTVYHPIEGSAPPNAIRALSAPDLRPQFLEAIGSDELMTRAVFRAQVGRFFVNEQAKDLYLPLFEYQIPTARDALYGLTAVLGPTVMARVANIPRLQSFPKPVTVAFGADDPYLNTAVAEGFHTAFPGSRLELVNDAGHYVQLDQPEIVVDIIRDAANAQ